LLGGIGIFAIALGIILFIIGAGDWLFSLQHSP
jgi:hypothetical protein